MACLATMSLCALALIGCHRGDPDYFGTIRPLHPRDEIWVNNGTEPEYIDPGKCADSAGGEVIQNIFAGLAEADPQTLDPIADIAHRWEISDDGKTYTFHLRDTVWSDGRPLTAEDFAWSWRRVLDPATASKYSIIMYVLQNGEAFNQQALFVTGLPEGTGLSEGKGTSIEAIQAWATSVTPVDHVQLSSDPPGAFVFLPTDTEGEGDSRATIVAALCKTPLEGNRVQVRVADSSVVGVHAIDDHTLVVHLENPVPYFLNLLTFYSYMPVPRHVIEDLEREGIHPDLWTRAQHIVSNGAYKLVQWKFRQSMLFEKNDLYWNAQAPDIARIRTVRASMVESYNTCLNLYRTGEIDFPGGNSALPSEFMDHLQRFKDFHASPYLGVYFFWFNTRRPPVDNVLVRKALSLAIDRQAITKYITRSGQIPIASLVPNGLGGYQALDSPLFDPKAARTALAEAGYSNGRGLPTITLIYNTSEGHKQIAAAMQQMWKEHLGIEVRIENQEWKVYLKNLQQTNFQIARMGWIGDYADPNTFLELFARHNGNNHSNWSDQRYDQLLAEANHTIDAKQRLRILREAESHAMQRQPILPVYVYTRAQMIKPYVRGYWMNYQDRHLWKHLWIDEDWYDSARGKGDR